MKQLLEFDEALRIAGTKLVDCPTKTLPHGMHKDESIYEIRGIKFRQTLDAPVDGIMIHPLVMGQILSDVSSNELIDIIKYTGSEVLSAAKN